MKSFKLNLATVILIFCCNLTQAQSLEQGDNLVNLDFGIGNLTRPSGFTTSIPPTIFQYEHAITNEITIGGYLGYSLAKFEDEGVNTIPVAPLFSEYQLYKWHSKHILFGAKATYHFGELLNTSKRLDPYGGVILGYNATTSRSTLVEGTYDLNPQLDPEVSGKVMVGIYIGGRYYFNEKIAAFGELGYQAAVLQLGITYKIP